MSTIAVEKLPLPTIAGKYMTREEERAYIELAQAGNIEARNRLIETNWPFIWSRCIAFVGRRQRYKAEDLVGEAVLGYVAAIEKYDATRGTRLSTVGSWYIFNALANFERSNRSVIRVPHWILVPAKNKPPRQRFVDQAKQCLRVGVIEGGIAGNLVRNNRIEPTEAIDATTVREIDAALPRLETRLRDLLDMRFTRGMTLHEIGERLGVTKERARQLERKALRDVRVLLGLEKPRQEREASPVRL